MKKQGFTLVELMVVVIIVGILAAVAVPLMTANKDKAKNSEAIAGLSAISTAARLYMVESAGTAPTAISDLESAGYLNTSDLVGTYIAAGTDYAVDWDSEGKVTSATVAIDGTSWTFTWDGTLKSYTAVKP
jgi:prepilin-type N-terminal cleavage/methylation domain-containing protein